MQIPERRVPSNGAIQRALSGKNRRRQRRRLTVRSTHSSFTSSPRRNRKLQPSHAIVCIETIRGCYATFYHPLLLSPLVISLWAGALRPSEPGPPAFAHPFSASPHPCAVFP